MAAVQASTRALATACSSAPCRASATAAAVARPRPVAQLRPALRSSRAAARRGAAVAVRAVLDVSDGTFEAEVLKSPVPVLVDFWATWCGPCKLMHPMMAWAEKEYGSALKVVKIEADPNQECIKKYNVHGLPCFIMFKDGQEVEGSHSEGAMSKKALTEYLAKHGVVPVAANA
ncbi:thioredoxin x [Micractinium conductrix]|uniref:Thioredoxin x n=1 Tax=Micractinium conductrix TaxID=554055 RepID=A0A2P6V0J6_9CHLO|nr:thioredoxin x [Micractinium conductrix]|eukprot:PSC67617.1 thioredoxin x [Micractinium conductrix]